MAVTAKNSVAELLPMDTYLSQIDHLVSEKGTSAAASAVHRARTVGFNETVIKMNKNERDKVLKV